MVVRREPLGSSSATLTWMVGEFGLHGAGNTGGKSFTSTIVITKLPRPTWDMKE